MKSAAGYLGILLAALLILATISKQPLKVGAKYAAKASGSDNRATSGGTADGNGNSFCARASMSSAYCPYPPVVRSVEMDKLMGLWYQVGSTALYKLRYEMGVACSQTKFSNPPGTPSISSAGGSVFHVDNSGIPDLRPRSSTTSALAQITSSATAICSSAAGLCYGGPLSASLFQLSALANSLPTKRRILSRASSDIQSTISDVNRQIESLVRSTAQITRTLSTISQSGGDASVLRTQIRSLRSTAIQAASELNILSGSTVGNLTSAQKSVNRVAYSISDTDTVRALLDIVNSLHVEIGTMIAEFSKLEEMLSNIGGPLSDIIAAEAGDSGSYAFTRITISSGDAAQEMNDQSGNFTIMLTQMFNASSDWTGNDRFGDPVIIDDSRIVPYQIIGVDRDAGSDQYRSILVYSCVADREGDGQLPLSDLVLLSRTPTLPLRSIVGLLDIANSHGINTDCVTTFVPTLQTSCA